jgi:O-antigen/teichoic acid export membrane protein
MVLSFPLALMSFATAGVLVGRLDIRSYNRQRLGGTALTTLGLVSLYAFRVDSLAAIVGVYLVVGVLTLGYSFAVLAHRRWLGFHPDLTLVGKLLSFGIRSHVGTVSGIANERADQALVSIALAPVYLGLYSVAVTVPSTVLIVGSSLATIALPAVTAVASEADMRRTLAQIVRITLVLSILVAVAMLAVIPAVITVFFGPAFLPAAPVAQVLLLASILLSVNRVTSAGLRAFNRPFTAGAGDLVGAGVTLVSLGLLVPMIGLMGAAIASALAYGANFGFNLWICGRLGISAKELLVPNSSDVQLVRATLRRSSIWPFRC